MVNRLCDGRIEIRVSDTEREMMASRMITKKEENLQGIRLDLFSLLCSQQTSPNESYTLPPYIMKNQSRLKIFPFIILKFDSKIESRKGNQKFFIIFQASKSPQTLDFTIKKEPKTFDSLERETGIEPATLSLARRCSTAEPLAHIYEAELSLRRSG